MHWYRAFDHENEAIFGSSNIDVLAFVSNRFLANSCQLSGPSRSYEAKSASEVFMQKRVIVAFHKSDKANGGSFEIDCLVFEKGHLWVLGGIFWVSYL